MALGLGGLIGIAFYQFQGALRLEFCIYSNRIKQNNIITHSVIKGSYRTYAGGVQRQFQEETKKYFNLN